MIILDTNVVSEFALSVPNTTVSDWIARQPTREMYITAITEAELRYGIEVMPVGRRRTAIALATAGVLQQYFPDRILPFDSAAASEYALIVSTRRAAGAPISQSDAQIAAIARARGAAVATRDVGGFSGCGIEVLDPWRA